MKKDYLLKKITEIFTNLDRGKVLDLGGGDGHYSYNLKTLDFDVTAADMDSKRFKYHDSIKFEYCDLTNPLPFADNIFDYVLFLEVVEHLRNPFSVIKEISRILKVGGTLILSTPNILNIGSRLRFLFEGGFDFFREPILDFAKLNKDNLQNLHIVVWRYQELEYLLYENKLHIKKIYTDFLKYQLIVPFLALRPLMALQCYFKESKASKKGGVNFKRINKILISKKLLLGRHLILQAKKIL